MLSLESLINCIEPNQESIYAQKKVINLKLPNIFEDYFDGYLENFYLFKNKGVSKSEFYNFIDSILSCIDKTYPILGRDVKMSKIKLLLKSLIVHFDEKNLYYKFGYNKNKKIKKQSIQEYLYKVFRGGKVFESIEDNYIDQFIVDYFGINLLVLDMVNGDITGGHLINSNRYDCKFNKFLPLLVVVKDGKMYHSVLRNDDSVMIRYSQNKKLVNSIYIKLKVNINRKEQEKMTISNLRELCSKKGVITTKTSEQTGKIINKKKHELIDDLGRLDFVN